MKPEAEVDKLPGHQGHVPVQIRPPIRRAPLPIKGSLLPGTDRPTYTLQFDPKLSALGSACTH